MFLSFITRKFYVEQVNHGEEPAALNSNAPVVQTILVTVYYEALCPDSRSFFVKQLLPTFERISENIQLKPIPYGKAKVLMFLFTSNNPIKVINLFLI